jgi:hypothetical protein
MVLFPGTPKMESRNCPETVLVGVPGLWKLISPDCQVRFERDFNQCYSSPPELFNAMSHTIIGHQKRSISDF